MIPTAGIELMVIGIILSIASFIVYVMAVKLGMKSKEMDFILSTLITFGFTPIVWSLCVIPGNILFSFLR